MWAVASYDVTCHMTSCEIMSGDVMSSHRDVTLTSWRDVAWCYGLWRHVMSYVKRLIPTRTVQEPFWTLRRHHHDVTVTSSMTPLGTFLWRNSSFWTDKNDFWIACLYSP